MYSFKINSFAAAIFLSALLMGAFGVFVVAATACIEYGWNFLAKHMTLMPLINPWQALLVYLAFASIVDLLGWVRIEIKTSNLD